MIVIKNIDFNQYVSYFYISDEYTEISSTAMSPIYAYKFSLKLARYLLIKLNNEYRIEIYK